MLKEFEIKLRLTLLARFANALADQVLLFAVPIFVYQLSQSALLTALTFGIEWVPRLIAIPVCGALADRFGGKILFQLSDIARCLLTLVLFGVVYQNPEPSFLLMGLFIGAIGFFHEQSFMALESSLPRMIRPDRLMELQSKLQLADISGQVLGPALAGLAVGFIDIKMLFLIVAMVYLLSLFFISFMPVFSPGLRPSKMMNSIGDGFKIFFNSKELIALSAKTFLLNILFGASLSITPAYIQDVFHWPAASYGMLMGFLGIFSAMVFFFLPYLVVPSKLENLGNFSYVTTIAGACFIGIFDGVWWYVAGLLLIYMGDTLYNVYVRTARIRHIPADSLGVVIGVAVLLNLSAYPIASVLVGLASEYASVQGFFMGAAILALVGSMLLSKSLVIYRPKIRVRS